MTTMRARGLTKDNVASAALGLLDDVGLPDVTMRRIAASLGVQPSALYWYFPNKQTLLAELADRILDGRASESVDADWPVLLRGEATALREALLAYRDSAEVVSSTMALGLGSDGAATRLATALRTSPFTEVTVRRAAATLTHFILGHVSLEQQRLHYDSLGARTSRPVMLDDSAGANDFAFGVDVIVQGLEVLDRSAERAARSNE